MSEDLWDPSVYESDLKPTEEAYEQTGRIAVIRTSDRIMYKRCRRRWGWQSHMRGNLGSKQNAGPLWYGSGFHFALEDFHGARRFPTAVEAFLAYVDATYNTNFRSLPADWQELRELGIGMLGYYENEWLQSRPPLRTFIYDGVPQVEVNFRIDIPFDGRPYGYDRVVYSGTLDRVIEDDYGQLWIVEYKTAKNIQTMHYAHDSQVSAYCWAGNHLYGDRKIAGVIYQQHRKDIPQAPKILANGSVSVSKDMLTTHQRYRSTLIDLYGSVRKAPLKNVEFLNELCKKEDVDYDKFIRRDRIERNEHACSAEGVKILMEVEEMLNPNLPLYPNPQRDCVYLCSFSGACASLDDGSDWEQELEALFEPRARSYDQWRKNVVYPDMYQPEG